MANDSQFSNRVCPSVPLSVGVETLDNSYVLTIFFVFNSVKHDMTENTADIEVTVEVKCFFGTWQQYLSA